MSDEARQKAVADYTKRFLEHRDLELRVKKSMSIIHPHTQSLIYMLQ
jgi:hypothetical protein